MKNHTGRAGNYITQSTGYRAFIPNPLPPNPPLKMDAKMQSLLSEVDMAIGRLDAVTELVPNPDFFVAMYVRKEAVLSSQIEGTQSSLSDLLEYEANFYRNGHLGDVRETFNYVDAMNHGLERLRDFPLSLRLLNEIHEKLLINVRGAEKAPGRFRDFQNWIGPGNCSLAEAAFVPPPPHEVKSSMGLLEKFIHDQSPMPLLIKCGLAHAQFETIHPYGDGNGRMGRLLITFLLCWRNALKRPLLYLSSYFKRNRAEYYDKLQAVRDKGDWEGWMTFFLEGTRQVAIEAAEKAVKIQQLRRAHQELIGSESSGSGFALIDYMFMRPYFDITSVAQHIGKSYPVAGKLVTALEAKGVIREITGRKKSRIYTYKPYLELFED